MIVKVLCMAADIACGGKRMAIQTSMYQRAGTIRRVVRRGAIHICGLCRRQYSEEDEAHDCVVSCWGELLSLNPVLRRRSLAIVHFRCRFCARDHHSVARATACAAACRRYVIDAFAVEDELYSGEDTASPRPRRVFEARVLPPPPPPRSASPKARAATEEPAAQAPPEAPPEAPAPAAAPAAAPAPVAKPAAAAPEAVPDLRVIPKDGDVFLRDGARYICKTCKAKYFTREDVFNCYEKHVKEAGTPG